MHLPFHCPIEPDEHVFGWLCRMHLLMGNLTFERTLKFLNIANGPFKSSYYNQPHKDALRLLHIQNTEEHYAHNTSEHTCLSLWAISLTPDVYELLLANAARVVSSTKRQAWTAYQMNWKYCPLCAQEDLARVGFSFWHVLHQLPGITHCCRHKKALLAFNFAHDLRPKTRVFLPSEAEQNTEIDKNLLDWSLFLKEMNEKLKMRPFVGPQLIRELKSFWGVPAPHLLEKTHFYLFKKLQAKFDEEVPEIIRRYLFVSPMDCKRGALNIFRIAMNARPSSKISLSTHPIYWLAILYWLKLRHEL